MKKTLMDFDKGGIKNTKVFFEFAKLSADYLDKFQLFLSKYEYGSLPGQKKITLRHLKSKGARLELPMALLKQHLKVSERRRHSLIEEIGFISCVS